MCGMCGLLGGPAHWSNSTPGAGQQRRQRMLQLARANHFLKLFRLELHDFHGQSYLLTTPTGRQELAPDFAALWRAVENLQGRPVDPLDMPWAHARHAGATAQMTRKAPIISDPPPA